MLDANDGDVVVQVARLSLGKQVVVDLAGAEDDLLDLVGRVRGRAGLLVDADEARAGQHLVEVGLGRAEQGLGRHDDERLAEGQLGLTTQQVHHVGGRGRIGHDHVDVVQLLHGRVLVVRRRRYLVRIVVAELEEALEARRRVLGSHALVAVRQEHDEAGLARPLGLTGGDELIDDALGGVGEVAELRLPHDQCVGVGLRVAELEAEHSVLGQRAVAHRVLGLVDGQVVERHVRVQVALLVVEHVVAVAERAALHILAAEADVRAFDEQRAEGERLADGPVGRALLDELGARVQYALEAAVHAEAVRGRHLAELLADLDEHLLGHARVRIGKRTVALEEALPRRVDPQLLLAVLLGLRVVVGVLQNCVVLLQLGLF